MTGSKRKRSPSAKQKSLKKGRSSKGKKIFAVIAVLGLILGAEVFSYLKNQLNQPRDFPVQTVLQFAGVNQPCGAFHPWDLVAGADWISISDQGNKRVLIFDRQGKFLREITEKQAGKPEFKEISRMTSDPSGNIYVIDTWNGLIRGFDRMGRSVVSVDLNNKGFYGPRGVAWDNGNFAVADTGSHRLVRVSGNGSVLNAWGQRGSGKAQFDNPSAVVVDAQENFYVVDSDNNRVECLDPKGGYLREYKIQEVPYSVALDEKQGLVYVSSLNGKFIKVFKRDGHYIGDLKDVSHKDQGIENIVAMRVLENGDVIAARHDDVLIFHPVSSSNKPS